jgi:hypothetical protein
MNLKEVIKTQIEKLELHEKIDYINDLRQFIHEYSPFKNEPVDFVRWVKNDMVVAND